MSLSPASRAQENKNNASEPGVASRSESGLTPGYSMSRFHFFFQAEDGIRDLTVTGVQTCALPISPALGALDDTVVVRARQGDRLADAELRDRRLVGAFELGGKSDRADPDDEALTGHEARHGMHRADGPGGRDRAGGAGEVIGREPARTHLADGLLVGGAKRLEVECVRVPD